MNCKMQLKLVSLFIFILLLCEVEVQAKAVDRSKHVSYTGPYDSSSVDLNPRVHPISKRTDMKDSSDIAPSRTGKPLYFEHDSIHKPENYENPLPDRLELSNYENLEGMFDTRLEFLMAPKYGDVQRKIDGHYEAKVGTKVHNDGDVFIEDQVFLHKNEMNRVKRNIERGATKSSSFQKRNLKTIDVGPPCDATDNHDYKNKSSDELASNINIHGMIYGNQHEQQVKSNFHEAISEDFHQYETKIVHKNVDSVQTESPIVSETEDKNTFEENFGRFNRRDDHIEKISTKLKPLNENLEDLVIPRETLNSNQPTEAKIPMKLNPQHIDTELVDSLSKTKEDKLKPTMDINHNPNSNFRSFVFNPNAQPQEVFQECKTPKNETGHCRYIQHCMLPSILSSVRHFMDNVCIIQEQFIGVCCPEFPVNAVLVGWPDKQDDFNSFDDTVEVPEDCGVGNNKRIVGGLDADIKAWPWMVALLNNQKKFFCGGSLINNRYVLTAAHCTFGPPSNQIVARLGEYDFNDPRDSHDDYSVIEIKRHGQYARFTLRNDIALLKLEKPVVFNEFVRTICLPDPGKDYLGKPATLAGWGHINGDSSSRRSNVLQEASFPIIGNDECGVSHGVPLTSSVICAAAPSRDKGACNGDSGGPLMLLDSDERWKVVGLVSWGRRGCNPKFPTAYSRITHYLDWIKEHTT